jgi:tyrosyl-tRNA synthetase
MVHDETALQKAEQATQVLFGGEIAGLSAGEVADIFADVPSGEVSREKLQGDGLPIGDLLLECSVFTSKGEARRAIEAGGIYLNNRRVSDMALKATLADAIDNQFMVLRRGRKNYWLVRIGN